MSDFAFLDIVFFALVAGFLILRLRSVLGRRTGNENSERWTPRLPGRGPRPAEAPRAPGGPLPDNVTKLPERGPAAETGPAAAPGSLEARLAQITAVDGEFDAPKFLGGARQAFEMIVTAFAQGDTAALRPLLADDVYDNFAAAIRGRQQAKQTLETTLIGITSADIIEARLDRNTAYVTVKFVSEQVNVTRNAAGETVDGEPNTVASVTDIWTFARRVRTGDPNWALVQTSESH